jgi:hypothetical protein
MEERNASDKRSPHQSQADSEAKGEGDQNLRTTTHIHEDGAYWRDIHGGN